MPPLFTPAIRRVAMLALAAASVLAACGGGDKASNQVYTATNTTANAIVHLRSDDEGLLTVANTVLTGGAGTNTGADPLTSESSIIVTPDNRTLFAVNAGDNSVSSFSIDPTNGNLSLLRHNATSGDFPVSLAYHAGYLYVLFQNSKTVQGYAVDQGVLSPPIDPPYAIPGAGTKPTEILMAPGGTHVLVSAGPNSNAIVPYPVGADGRLGSAVRNSQGIAAPFAAAFVNNRNTLLSTNVSGHSLQSLSFTNHGPASGTITANGPDVLGDPLGAPCWLALTPNGQFVYAGNGGSGTISAYRITGNTLTLVNAKAADEMLAVAGDSWISPDGRYLYSTYLADGSVIAYAIGIDGSLTKRGTRVPVTSGNTMQGLAGIQVRVAAQP